MGRSEIDGFRDHCGVVGIVGNPEAAHLTYLALYALQHRGQDSCGIVSYDPSTEFYHRRVKKGLVADGFNPGNLSKLIGDRAIGHVRYTTAGFGGLLDAQPLLAKTGHGKIALAHNGNLINNKIYRRKLEDEGAIFQTTSDTEIVCHLYARSKESTPEARLISALNEVRGAYSITALLDGRLYAARDPHGVRPLIIGKLDKGYVVSSEDSVFNLIGAEYVREVEPGELVCIPGHSREGEDLSRIHSHKLYKPRDQPEAKCIFEHVYFSRPDSTIFGRSVHQSRRAMGRALAKSHPIAADVVIAVPDSGVIAAMGYAQEAGIPFDMGLVRNHYVGRTFIEPENKIRNFGVKIKLSPVKSIVEGKRVVVVDDSIVRGTTSKKIVQMLRSAGAKEVHMRVSAPPTTDPCFYGIDTPTRSELIASSQSIAAIADHIQVDSLGYLSAEDLHASVGRSGMCDACFTGNYPIKLT